MIIAGDILWYRGFHDVPRVFCLACDEGVYVFESRFDGAIDEYDDTYDVWLIRDRDAARAEPDTILAIVSAQEPLARVPVPAVTFDSTRRRTMRLDLPKGVITL